VDARILQILRQTAQHFNDNHAQAYLVGGSLRNLLLGEPTIDWDIVTAADAPTVARQLANKLGGFYAHLHEKASRVVVKQQAGETVLDISPLNGKTIEDDLRCRDFTINAMALSLDEAVRYLERVKTPDAVLTSLEQAILIDPAGGFADIAAHRLRAVNKDVFKHDPLRMLRAVRLMMRYGLSIEPETQRLIALDAPLLKKVAPERVHDEFYAILEPGGATNRLRFLDELGLFTVIFPEFIPARGMQQPFPHYWDVLEHSIESVGALERLAAALQGEIRVLLDEAEEQGIFSFEALRSPRVKMAALLHDIGKTVTYATDQEGHIHFYYHPQAGVPLAQEIMRRLRASTQDRRFVQQVVAHHMRPGQLGQDGPVTLRATRRYFADLGPVGIYVALISLADHLATMGPQPLGEAWERHLGVVSVLLTRYVRERETILPPRLVTAEELMRRLRLEPGPQVGRLLDLIAEAQTEGRVSSKEEAIWLAEDVLAIDEDAEIADESSQTENR